MPAYRAPKALVAFLLRGLHPNSHLDGHKVITCSQLSICSSHQLPLVPIAHIAVVGISSKLKAKYRWEARVSKCRRRAVPLGNLARAR